MKMQKSPVDIDALRDPAVENNASKSLAEACLDYVQIQQYGKQKTFTDSLLLPFQQRLRTGESLLIIIKEMHEQPNGAMKITGRINYGPFPYENPESVLSSLRHKDKRSSSTGEMVYGVKVNFSRRAYSKATFDFPEADDGSKPDFSDAKKCPRFTIDYLNKDGVTGTIELTEMLGKGYGKTYMHNYSKDADEYLSPGDYVLLEKSPDAYVAESMLHVLRNPQYNGVNRFLNGLMNGSEANETTAFDKTEVMRVVDWMDEDTSPVYSPNPDQRAFITDVDHELVMLQGPPGTGKTKMATAPAMLSRILGHTEQRPCRSLVTGASNKAINEVMEEFVELVKKFNKQYTGGDILDDMMLLRMAEEPEPGTVSDDVLQYVTFANTHDDDWPNAKLQSRLKKHRLTTDPSKHIVVFATPRRVWKLGKKLIDNFVLQQPANVDAHHVKENPGRADLMPYELFDMMVVDEGSMMEIPQFLLAGTFYDSGGTILVSGDHRQLPPVQEHDWENELAPSIAARAPYLSVLNFGRLLGGEEMTVLSEETKRLLTISPVTHTKIPLHQLQRTYRCHTDVAEFLEKWVYMNLDGIHYKSSVTDTLPFSTTGSAGIQHALEPDHPLVVITYDDDSYQQVNPLEAEIATQLITSVEVPGLNLPVEPSNGSSDDDVLDELFGIVTPHNAQRGLLESMIYSLPSEIDDTDQSTRNDTDGKADGDSDESDESPYRRATDIDTVERFQGGQRDMMIVSGTVSDPDYVDAESEFLLNLNRLNVAMSRMKQKLVVIASNAVFDHIPLDVDEYDQALLWKGLAKDTGLTDDSVTPVWRGSLTEFTGKSAHEIDVDSIDPETKISIYYIQ